MKYVFKVNCLYFLNIRNEVYNVNLSLLKDEIKVDIIKFKYKFICIELCCYII